MASAKELGLDPDQFRVEIVKPAISLISGWSLAAENLVLGTAFVESRLRYVRQIKGPALGLFQMEPATYHDIWENYVSGRTSLATRLQALAGGPPGYKPAATNMVGNLPFACAMCRVFYLRLPSALPGAGDALAMANYHKKYYNTYLGATKVDESMPWFQLAIDLSK